jgi:hypothetical protein
MCAAALAWDDALKVEPCGHACQRDPARRQRLGCEGDAPRPVAQLPCWACDPEHPDPSCETCTGVGLVAWRRCLHRSASQPGAAELVSYVTLVEVGINPWPCAVSELPAEVAAVFGAASSRRAYYHRQREKAREGRSTLPPLPEGQRPDVRSAMGREWPGVVK